MTMYARAVAWLESAFAFRERVRIGDGHRAQLRVGSDGAVVVADVGADRVAPSGGGGVTHIVKVRVPDVDAAFARAREAGAQVVEELTTWEYGERSGVVEDIGGHRWELTQTVRDVAPEDGVGRQSPPGDSWVGCTGVPGRPNQAISRSARTRPIAPPSPTSGSWTRTGAGRSRTSIARTLACVCARGRP